MGGGGVTGGLESKTLSQIQPLSSASVTIAQSIAMYLHVNNCMVIIIEYRSVLHDSYGGCSSLQNTDRGVGIFAQ